MRNAFYGTPRLPERFWTKIKPTPDGHWLWTGARINTGYGLVKRIGGPGSALAHREVYTSLVGPIPEHLEIDHVCRNRMCVNPAHLEAVTHAINVERSPAVANAHAAIQIRKQTKTHCRAGHQLSGNEYEEDGQRRCLTCKRENRRADYQRHREQILAKRKRDRSPA